MLRNAAGSFVTYCVKPLRRKFNGSEENRI